MQVRKLAVAAGVATLALGATPSALAKHHHKPGHRTPKGHKHHPAAKARSYSFTATVVKSNAGGLELRTADGKLVNFSSKQIHAARHAADGPRALRHDLQISTGGVVINLLGLQPGVTVDVTVTINPDGTTTVSISLPSQQPTGESASGVISDLSSDALTLTTADGSQLRLHMAPDALAALNLSDCTTADAVYDQVAGLLIARSITPTGTSSAGDCAPTSDTTGVITDVGDDHITLSTADGSSATFSVDPSSGLTDGYQQGDLVDVTSVDNGDGTQTATAIEYVEQDVSGTVSSVTTNRHGGSITITDDSGNTVTLSADQNHGVQLDTFAFNGIQVGDSVEATYHQVAGTLVADTVGEH